MWLKTINCIDCTIIFRYTVCALSTVHMFPKSHPEYKQPFVQHETSNQLRLQQLPLEHNLGHLLDLLDRAFTKHEPDTVQIPRVGEIGLESRVPESQNLASGKFLGP